MTVALPSAFAKSAPIHGGCAEREVREEEEKDGVLVEATDALTHNSTGKMAADGGEGPDRRRDDDRVARVEDLRALAVE